MRRRSNATMKLRGNLRGRPDRSCSRIVRARAGCNPVAYGVRVTGYRGCVVRVGAGFKPARATNLLFPPKGR